MLHNVWVFRKSEPVSDTFRVEEKGIDEVVVCISAHVKSLSTVEEKWNLKVFRSAFALELEKLGDKVLDWSPPALFANKIEAYTS